MYGRLTWFGQCVFWLDFGLRRLRVLLGQPLRRHPVARTAAGLILLVLLLSYVAMLFVATDPTAVDEEVRGRLLQQRMRQLVAVRKELRARKAVDGTAVSGELRDPGGFERFKRLIRPPAAHRQALPLLTQLAGHYLFGCKQHRWRDWNADPVRLAVPMRDTLKQPRPVPGRCTHGRKFPCDIPCVEMREGEKEADAALFVEFATNYDMLMGDTETLYLRKHGQLRCPLQQWVHWSMESEKTLPDTEMNADNMLVFDVMANTRLGSDVPLVYGNTCEYDFSPAPVPFAKKRTDAIAVAVVSNCVQHRLDYIAELIKHGVTVHSYGRCMTRAPFTHKEMPAADTQPQGWFGEKCGVIRDYKFVLAFENTEVEDYVSEKFFHALVAGSVPVHRGTAAIHLFEPSATSILSAHDFPSAKDLAARMIELAGDEAKYEAYLAWKRTGPSDKFLRVMNVSDVSGMCRICHLVKHNIQKLTGQKGDE